MSINYETCKVSNCSLCDISLNRTKIVSGNGNLQSNIMLIGEAPGKSEDQYGFPFIGESGIMLRKLMRSYGMEPKDFYITNTVKCRPPSNRRPSHTEISNCISYLVYEIFKVNPILIVLLGNTAFKTIFPNSLYTINKVRGKLLISGGRIYLPTYHPSYVLRNKDNNEIKEEFNFDIKLLYYLTRLIYS